MCPRLLWCARTSGAGRAHRAGHAPIETEQRYQAQRRHGQDHQAVLQQMTTQGQCAGLSVERHQVTRLFKNADRPNGSSRAARASSSGVGGRVPAISGLSTISAVTM